MSHPAHGQNAVPTDDRTLARRLSLALPHPAISLRVKQQEQCLQVLVESAQTPDQATLIPILQRELEQLHLPVVDTARIYGRRQGDRTPAWTVIISLAGATPLPPPDRATPPIAALKHLAQTGDREAIRELIYRSVAHKQIQATVVFGESDLDIVLESAIPPDATIATTLIQRALMKVPLTSITTIRLVGIQTGADRADWIRELPLDVLQAPTALSTAAIRQPSGGPSSGRPRSSPTFTLTVADVRRLAANLNPLKAGLIALLALYGILNASNYTVDGFLAADDRVMMFLHGVNLIFHEAGHTILAPFGQFLHILGGSLMQVMIPVGIASYFFVTRQPYASTIALWWAAQSLWDVSIYINDAQERTLPLLGGEGVLHDWHFLLLDMHLLAQGQVVGSTVFALGTLLYLVAMASGLYYSRRIE